MRNYKRVSGLLAFWILFAGWTSIAAQVDLSKYDPACGIVIRQESNRLKAEWQSADRTACAAQFSLEPGAPLLRSLETDGKILAANVRPVFVITTGARVQRPGVKYIFFDKPATGKNGPVRQFTATLDTKTVRVESAG